MYYCNTATPQSLVCGVTWITRLRVDSTITHMPGSTEALWPCSYGYESTQPPAPLLKALLHSDCTGTEVLFFSVMSAAAP
jgi:hypothetical protein